jgi:pimeloyl-ACP methyl ester carboxylesterase
MGLSVSYLTPLLALLTIGAGTGQAPAGPAGKAPPIAPYGRLVDLGGWRLHLHCTGEARAGRPTVLLEAGAGGFSVDWNLVQPRVAEFARVCSYDRAGLGWSDLGPHPRTMRQVTWELHALLEKAEVKPPFVLVGHSWGGIMARLYAFTFPGDVVGMVLDESGHERGTQVLRNGKLVRLVDEATGRAVPDVKTSGPLHEADIPAAARTQIEAAAASMAPRANDPPRNNLPADAQRMRAWAFAQVKHWAANDNPFEGEELAALFAKWSDREDALGGIPVVVLSRGRSGSDAALEEEHRANQVQLLRLSRRARQAHAERSGHLILIEEPDVTVAAIRDVIDATRR